MATISGTIIAVDTPHGAHIVGGDLRTGTLLAVDSTHQTALSGVVIGDSTRNLRDSTFVQGKILESTDLILNLIDATYINGSWSGDGTFVDSTYWIRPYNPIWLNYSIWFLEPPDATEATLQGYRLRTAANPQVGQFYANMYAPDDPGRYEIRWRYQKDSDSLGNEIIEPFSVSSWGIIAEPDYT